MTKKRVEYNEMRGGIFASDIKCNHCGRVTKANQTTYRFVKNGRRKVGNGSLGERDAVQGPLCPNCSEIPPEKMPWRRGHWW